MNSDNAMVVACATFIGVIFIGIIVFLFNQGSIDRFWTNLNKDKTTAKDEIYQTGSIRVYKFINDGNICYLADKQSQSTSIYCVK